MRSIGRTAKLLGSGNPPLHRFRIGLEFAVSGHRDLDGMVEHHADVASVLAGQLGLPDTVLGALRTAYERWDGRGWPGKRSGDAFYVPGGHLQRVDAGTEYVQFSPGEELREVSEAIAGNLQQLQGAGER